MKLLVFIPLSLSCFIVVLGCSNYHATPQQTAPVPIDTGTSSIPQPEGSLSCKKHGCAGDGVSDDTESIRATIADACQQGGGIVYLPAGTFKVQPQTLGEDVLTLPCDNLTLTGAGKTFTALSAFLFGGGTPNSSCPTINTPSGVEVWRGSGIVVTGTNNIVISNLTLNGHALKTGDRNWPSTVADCYGWDITNKGINISNQYTGAFTLAHTHITGFLGELVYGGIYTNQFVITDNEIDTSNGDGISTSAGLVATSNTIHDLSNAGFEDELFKSNQTISNNLIQNVVAGIVGISNSNSNAASAGFLVSNNQIISASQDGFMGIEIHNLALTNNTFIDSGTSRSAIYLENSTSSTLGDTENVAISNNLIESKYAPIINAILFVSGNGGPTVSPWSVNLTITGNQMTQWLSTGGKIGAGVVHCSPSEAEEPGLTISGNSLTTE